MGRRGWKQPGTKLPAQSWTIKEKLDWVVAVLTDHRLTYATRVIGATMAVYFHNTQSGALHPSREQVTEKTGAERQKVRLATQALRRFGFLTYEDSDGGCNHRNTYHLLKQSPKVEALTGAKNTPLTGGKNTLPQVGKTPAQGGGKTPAQLSLEDTAGREDPEALPLPRDGEASASIEKERGLQEEPPGEPTRPTEAEREAHIAEVERMLGRRVGKR